MSKNRVVLFPYKMASESGKNLAQLLGIKRVFADGKYRPRTTDLVINWGNTAPPDTWDINVPTVLNHPDAVDSASNKIIAFRRFDSAGIPTIDWTLDEAVAREWY